MRCEPLPQPATISRKHRSQKEHPFHGGSVYGATRRGSYSSPPCRQPIERLESYARLAVQVGLNLQPGQILGINALIEHAPFARAIAREAYAAGARYVDVLYTDQHVRRAHIELAGPIAARLLAAVARRAPARTRRDRRSALRDHRQPGARAVRRPRRRARRQGAHARGQRGVAEADRRPLQLDDRRLSRTKAGRARSSASRTSSASGRPSARPCGSTSPIRSRPGASTSAACRSAPPP